jgi:hypothetical protein
MRLDVGVASELDHEGATRRARFDVPMRLRARVSG